VAKLSKTFADKVQSPASGYAIHWDDKVPGYGLRVRPPAFAASSRREG